MVYSGQNGQICQKWLSNQDQNDRNVSGQKSSKITVFHCFKENTTFRSLILCFSRFRTMEDPRGMTTFRSSEHPPGSTFWTGNNHCFSRFNPAGVLLVSGTLPPDNSKMAKMTKIREIHENTSKKCPKWCQKRSILDMFWQPTSCLQGGSLFY